MFGVIGFIFGILIIPILKYTVTGEIATDEQEQIVTNLDEVEGRLCGNTAKIEIMRNDGNDGNNGNNSNSYSNSKAAIMDTQNTIASKSNDLKEEEEEDDDDDHEVTNNNHRITRLINHNHKTSTTNHAPKNNYSNQVTTKLSLMLETLWTLIAEHWGGAEGLTLLCLATGEPSVSHLTLIININ